MNEQPVVFISGVAGGIGRATARRFAEEGWHVVGADQQQPEPLPPDVHRFFVADVADSAAMKHLFADIEQHEGRIDALVNNAAIQLCKPLVETLPEEWDSVITTNLRSVYLAVRFAYPLLSKQGGAIVNVSSVHAVATSANIAAYATSKGGMLALTRALAIELAPAGIRVNAVLPGAVDTPMLQAGLSRGHLEAGDIAALLDQLARRTVIQRVGTPEEIARSVLFLADHEQSSFITGQALVVDGGATARLSTE